VNEASIGDRGALTEVGSVDLIPRSRDRTKFKALRAPVFQGSPHGQVAQLVEQRTENPRVGSSILPLATMHDSSNRPLTRLANGQTKA
jgi:hypothetical protein